MDPIAAAAIKKMRRDLGLPIDKAMVGTSLSDGLHIEAIVSIKVGAFSLLAALVRHETVAAGARGAGRLDSGIGPIPLVVFGRSIGQDHRLRYQRLGVGYVDLDGPIYVPLILNGDQVGSSTQVSKSKERLVPLGTRNRGGLETLLLLLLSNPSHLRLKQTSMASQAGLTIVTTNRWLQTLVERGDLVKLDRGYAFTHIEQSLNEWLVLHKQRRSELYHSETFELDFPRLGRMVSPSGGAYAGGATAAERLGLDIRPDGAVLYCDSEARIKLLKSLRLRPAHDGHFEIRTKYWEFDNWLGQSDGVAPLPLVYADLIVSVQARARDIAPKVFDKICRAHIEQP